ncbi:MAG: hypothetical protein H6642_19085, partial [Caldilineaceae bacterium]|nr:hypothetical protein [Caldilineaceae bacterium]
YSLDWDIPYIAGQSGVRFKLRAVDVDVDVDNDELVREAAGGVSAAFTLQRTKAVTTFRIPDFEDDILHHDGQYPDIVERFIDLPPDVNTYNEAYILGSFWRTPRIALNNGSSFRAFETGEDDWALSIRSINVGDLQPGQNKITYSYTGGFGQFIESPGPMIVLRRTGATNSDTTAPWVHREVPLRNAVQQDPGTTIELQLYDSQSGVDLSTLEMSVDGVVVAPDITGDRYNYTLRYTPPAPLPRDHPIPVVIDVKDNDGNPLTDSYSFTVDGNGPTVSNVICVRSSDSEATISWATDEPATGRVDYGPTNSFGQVANATTVARLQSVALSGLGGFPETRYQVTAIDIYGNETTAAEAVCPQDAQSTIQSDDFNLCTLSPELWTFTNPRNDATLSANGSELQIDVPGGQSHDVWSGGNFAPRIMQPANNVDFSVDVKFLTSVTQGIQLQGLLVEQDANNLLRFNMQVENGAVKVLGINFNNGSPSVKFNRTLNITPVNQPVYMRLIRSGVNWTLLYSFNGTDWQNGGSFDRGLEVSSVGVFVGNAGSNAPAYTSIIDYFFLTDAPIEPEDGYATRFSDLAINVTPDGAGAVVGGPNVPSDDDPLCGTPLELLAEPVPGWRLAEWQIVDAEQPDTPRTATENPLVEQFLRTDVITALFLQNHYELMLDVVDEQGVSVPNADVLVSVTSPASQAGYIYNENAVLTASDADGWYFDHWSGDLASANSVETIVFTGTANVTANYLRRYTLDIEIVDENGAVLDVNSVTVNSPADPRGYAPDETATLLAVSAPGWRFVGWNPELGSGAEISISMTDDMVVQAIFARERYAVSAEAVDAEGNPLADVTPTVSSAGDPAGYVYEEVVTLTTPETAGERQFLRWTWTGDAERVSQPGPTAQFKIRGNVSFQAIYTESLWTLTMLIAEGDGSIQTSPDGDRFLDGENVTLTAVSASGWAFAGWSGDVPQADRDQATVTLLMDANKTVEAHFVVGASPVLIYLPVIRD